MIPNSDPVLVLRTDAGYTLRVYCAGDLRRKAAAFLTATARNRRQAETSNVDHGRRNVDIVADPLTLE